VVVLLFKISYKDLCESHVIVERRRFEIIFWVSHKKLCCTIM